MLPDLAWNLQSACTTSHRYGIARNGDAHAFILQATLLTFCACDHRADPSRLFVPLRRDASRSERCAWQPARHSRLEIYSTSPSTGLVIRLPCGLRLTHE